MIKFDRLALSGFKSFVDKAELDISPGLTGIVGPNGCGKSNLVEALRWAMGESSAKRMRGGDMDDVIFNGTAGRPARNFAEVVLYLNNGMHTAPEPYAAFEQIEISRRIERESGSTYRINGKIARARDVQLLLADTMTGANSPALVSQGKLTQIITAKPFDRRMILEESAGITGLHARRHEAELRLQAADNNLARLQDSVGALETQLNSLKRQSRQAEKYRVITDEIKQLETVIAGMEWIKLARQKQLAEHEVTSIESTVADALLTLTQLTQTLDTQSADLPALRSAAAESAARYQAIAIELRQLDNEEQQVTEAIADAKNLINQSMHDIDHEQQLLHDAEKLLAALESEQQQLQNEMAEQSGRLPVWEQTRDAVAARLQGLEEDLQNKTRALIETQARRDTLLKQIAQDELRQTANRTRADEARMRLAGMQSSDDAGASKEIEAQIAIQETQLNDLHALTIAKTESIRAAEEQVTTTRSKFNTAREQLTQLQSEKKPLEGFLSADLTSANPILNDIKAEIGFETALATALGETLFGSTDEQGSIVWRGRNGLNPPAFPPGVAPIDEKVKAPAALHTALGYIGYVESRGFGDVASLHLQPGQILVSKDGYLWRWDGLFIKPTAKDRHAVILEQKNRLAEIIAKLPHAEVELANTKQAFDQAEVALVLARTAQENHMAELRTAQNTLNMVRANFQRSLQAQQHHAAEHARLNELLNVIDTDNAERAVHIDKQKQELALLPDPTQSGMTEEVSVLRDQTLAVQSELRDATLTVDRYTQEQSRRQARLHGIADQRIATQNQSVRAHEHMAGLQNRKSQAQTKLDGLLEQPRALASKRETLMSRLSTLEQDKTARAAELQTIENEVAATARALREAEGALSSAKETRAGLLERLSSLIERLGLMESEITSLFNMTPNDLITAAQLSHDISDTELTECDAKRQRKDKLIRDRDAIGPVNLRADVEAQEIAGSLGKIISERTDLLAAIDELRGGIATINNEAKERLTQAFDTINTHFKDLFTRLFGGGQAYLQMVETDGDPLAAGLEIYAQPPGKTLQSISLLSGGEQSLTAAALIFAMFLTNPSPICVLDEIDAPLDDANVDRICSLLRHITDTCQTRFLVVTHHRLTMAKMDRLYGVTMGEKGVSQLVSVDLSQQLDLLEAA